MPDENPVTPLSDAQCWELLATQEVGRLATSVERRPEIFPVNYALDDHTLVFRTAQGTKLFELTVNSNVAFETDSWEGDAGWSVVLQGVAEQIESGEEIEHVETLGLHPWVPTVKTIYIRIRPHEISGRQFQFGPEPEMF